MKNSTEGLVSFIIGIIIPLALLISFLVRWVNGPEFLDILGMPMLFIIIFPWGTVGALVLGIVLGARGITRTESRKTLAWLGVLLNLASIIMLEIFLREIGCSIRYGVCF